MPRILTRTGGPTLVWAWILIGISFPVLAESLDPVDYITGQIICDCGCTNLTVKDCTCGRADQVRAEVATELNRGKTPDQILQAYVAEYGEQILASPSRKGFNLVGWWMPFAVVLVGTLLLLLAIRKWSRVPTAEAPLIPPLGASPTKSPDPSFLKRVEEEMMDLDR